MYGWMDVCVRMYVCMDGWMDVCMYVRLYSLIHICV